MALSVLMSTASLTSLRKMGNMGNKISENIAVHAEQQKALHSVSVNLNTLAVHFLHILKSWTLAKHPSEALVLFKNCEIILVKSMSMSPPPLFFF